MKFKVEGAAAMIKKIMALRAGFKKEVGGALYYVASQELRESQARVPVDFGILKASGFVTLPDTTKGDRISVTIGYGGAAAEYAVFVHENLDAHHEVGQAKYLESVLRESAPHILARVAKRFSLRNAGGF